MMAVKIIRTKAVTMENEINAFLQTLGSQPDYKVSVPDIKINRIGGQNDIEEAMIIYTYSPRQNNVPQPYDPTRPRANR